MFQHSGGARGLIQSVLLNRTLKVSEWCDDERPSNVITNASG